jgi:anti-sigma28 factor (negative regulator of flagellin synthesis)
MSTIDKSRLVQSLSESLLRDSAPVTQRKVEPEAQSASNQSQAVQVDSGFGSGSSVSPERLAELRSQVQSGQYNPDLTKVAEAVARDLFA